MQVKGSRIMITGASGGLGAAIARDLASFGAELILTARSADALEELSAETGGEVVVADLSDRTDVDRLCEMFDHTDVLVANAGVGFDGRIEDVDTAAVDFTIDVNLRSPIVMSVRFAQQRIESGRDGQIVLMGSLSGLAATPNTRLYNATKFGLRGFALSLRQDLEPHGIGVTLVAPGFIDTAGMFASNGIDLPPYVRTKAPQDVAVAVRRAIERDPVEIYVSPTELRVSAMFSTVAPGLSAAIQRRLGTAEMTADP